MRSPSIWSYEKSDCFAAAHTQDLSVLRSCRRDLKGPEKAIHRKDWGGEEGVVGEELEEKGKRIDETCKMGKKRKESVLVSWSYYNKEPQTWMALNN